MFETRRRKKVSDSQLIELLRNSSNSFDRVDHADAPQGAKTVLTPSAGNPNFTAQFDISILLKYFSVAAGAYTERTAAYMLANEPTLANDYIPAFVFGNSDYNGGYAKLKSLFPLTVWAYDNVFTYGQGTPSTIYGNLDATARAVLQAGDVVIPLYGSPGATDYVCFVIIRCRQVGYGTLLDALNSDSFVTNMLRYIISDTTATGLAQYENNVKTLRQSLFGKSTDDFVSPNSFKLPEQQQAGIIDIPLVFEVDKAAALGTYVNYDVVNIQWSIFVKQVNKL